MILLRLAPGLKSALGAKILTTVQTKCTNNCLLVTRDYPSDENLYKYPFVHRRVLGYRDHGTEVEVFNLGAHGKRPFYEFEQVHCQAGSLHDLSKLLSDNHYQTILVHGLSADIWPALLPHIKNTRIFGWLHGSEIHSLHRFATLGKSQAECVASETEFEKRIEFWRKLLKPMPANLELVFVSRFSADYVMNDLGFTLPEKQYHVIPNPIDTKLFNFQSKSDNQRKKIISIRPFDTSGYANDLTVKAILALSEKPFFNDLEFRIIGDGKLFGQTLAPLRKFDNVTIEQRFMHQHEIARLYKEFGIFLAPTRFDTHGVSRDEAMASGLVALTNNVAAVGEYANENCAILAGKDEYLPLAAGLEKLYAEPALFQKLSKAAARQVSRQTANNIIIPQEIELFTRPPVSKAK
jgi:glycosyltransferase involved in cell wall biosynthesis